MSANSMTRGHADSVVVVYQAARCHLGTSGGKVCATALASLYNGERVKFDLSDVRRLDSGLFEHLMSTIRICYELNAEPHSFLPGGGADMEELIELYGLEKKKRRARS